MKNPKIKVAVANPLILSKFAHSQKMPFGSLAEKRIVTLEWLKCNMAGHQVQNAGYMVKLSWQGLKNDISHHHGNNVSKLHSFTVIDRIIKNAKFLGSEPDKRGNPQIIWLKFYSKVKIKRSRYDVFIYLKQTQAGAAIYDHILFLE